MNWLDGGERKVKRYIYKEQEKYRKCKIPVYLLPPTPYDRYPSNVTRKDLQTIKIGRLIIHESYGFCNQA